MNEARIESKAADYTPDKKGQAELWDIEIKAAKKNQENFWEKADEAIKEFLGEGKGKRLNLFHGDVVSKGAQLYGNVPRVRARRRFADANDDTARVSAEALERLLNTDIERDHEDDGDGFREALENALTDWMLAGLGQVRLRYVVKWEDVAEQPAIKAPCRACGGGGMVGSCVECSGTGEMELAPVVPASKQKVPGTEDVVTDHINWRDFLWSPCRTWGEVRWVGFKAAMDKDAFTSRFPEAKGVSFAEESDVKAEDNPLKQVLKRVDVWEIWDKTARKRLFHIEGHPEILEEEDDPLGLPGFFPCPKPLAANLTTSRFIPKPPFELARDLYEEAHELSFRIKLIVKAIKVAGVYDKTNQGLERLVNEACENELIPVASFAAMLEKGGIANAIQWMPIEPFVKALVELVNQRNQVIAQIHQITGMSDIMRGQAEQKATATEQRIKARFGGSRIISEQRRFAKFAAQAQRIRAHLIATNYDSETIIERSNLLATQDAQLAPQAVEFLKEKIAQYRIEVDEESLGMTDFDAVQQDGIAIMQATAEFFQRFAPFMQNPTTGQFVLELYQQFISQFRGAQRFEAVIDRGIAQLKAAAMQPPRPDPKAQALQMKAQIDKQKAGLEMQGLQAQTQAKVIGAQADIAKTQAQMQLAQAKAAMPADPGAPGGEF